MKLFVFNNASCSVLMRYSFRIKIRDGPDSSFAGYPAYRISSHFENRIPDISDIDRVTQIIETSQIFKQE